MREDGVEPEIPVIDGIYLVDYLHDIGPAMSDGAITWQEIAAWQEQTGVELQPWEAQLLRRLSIDYWNESYKAKNPKCPPPYGGLKRNPNLNQMIDSFLD